MWTGHDSRDAFVRCANCHLNTLVESFYVPRQLNHIPNRKRKHHGKRYLVYVFRSSRTQLASTAASNQSTSAARQATDVCGLSSDRFAAER